MVNVISNKQEAFTLYEAGEFGNRLRIWRNHAHLSRTYFDGYLTMRYAEANSHWCKYRVHRKDVIDVLCQWRDENANLTKVKFNEAAPDDRLIIQGNIQQHAHEGYVLNYSTDRTNMKEAMKNAQTIIGQKAIDLLQKHFSKESMKNLERLLNTYYRSVIEFSTYDHMLGDVPDNNTIFWEVRNY